MKKLLFIYLFLPISSYAQYMIQLSCFDTQELFKLLKKQFVETPFVMGKSDNEAKSVMILWTNVERKSWTITSSIDETSCVVGYGQNLKVIELTN
jgi:hypothetical protein